MIKFRFVFLVFAISLLAKIAFSGDTIRVMHYNLLYYDKNTSFCTSTNNNVDLKDGYLRTITGHYQPDIFTVNEMNGSVTSVSRLLNNVFNVGDVSHYKRANYTGSYLVNILYYNSQKLEMHSQNYILTSPRLTDVYRLYYKSDNLELGDTTFITCIVTHLKAGNTPTDQADRSQAAGQIMNYINNRGMQGNILFMGDFNVYTSSEPAFQTFMTPTSSGVRFYDPVNALGDWQNDPAFAQYHTQSTHNSSTSSGCHSTGGMDDRFDFILATESVLEGTRGLKYIDDSYWAFGQDGNRLNQTLTNPPNNSLPSNVINALFNMSDHLPVVMELHIDSDLYTSTSTQPLNNNRLKVTNPFQSTIDIWSSNTKEEAVNIQVINLLGAIVLEKRVNLYPGEKTSVEANSLSPGIYLFRAEGSNLRMVSKIIKQ